MASPARSERLGMISRRIRASSLGCCDGWVGDIFKEMGKDRVVLQLNCFCDAVADFLSDRVEGVDLPSSDVAIWIEKSNACSVSTLHDRHVPHIKFPVHDERGEADHAAVRFHGDNLNLTDHRCAALGHDILGKEARQPTAS